MVGCSLVQFDDRVSWAWRLVVVHQLEGFLLFVERDVFGDIGGGFLGSASPCLEGIMTDKPLVQLGIRVRLAVIV